MTKPLFSQDFRNLALEKSVVSVGLLRAEAGAGLQPFAVTFPSQGARTEVFPSRMWEQ